jgi:hypothetical protein
MAARKSTWRNVSITDRVLLWGRAAARCGHPDCKRFLVEPATDLDAEAMYGQAAHMAAHSPGGPRFDPNYPQAKLDSYDNLLLLCGNCHTIVDKQPNTYTTDQLRSWKEEHESWVRQVTEPQQRVPVPWIVLIQEDSPQIDASLAFAALEPDVPNGDPRHLLVSSRDQGWSAAATEQATFVEGLLSSSTPAERRLAVFSLTRIPLAVHLGYLLSDRCRVQLFQYHRDEQQWRWPTALPAQITLPAVEREVLDVSTAGSLVLRVSLSATVDRALAHGMVGDPVADVHISVPTPSVNWLRCREQLVAFAGTIRAEFEWAREDLGERCNGIHLFYAGPTGGAIEAGRQYNPRMNPPLHLYEYHHARELKYERVLEIGGSQ